MKRFGQFSDQYSSMRSKSFDKRLGPSRTPSATPDFSRIESQSVFQPNRPKSNPRKPLVPKLPLDSLLQQSIQASLNLSAIGLQNTAGQNKQPIVILNDSDQLMDLLQQKPQWQEVSNTLQLSPVVNHKTHSRLDQSSIVDCQVLVDRTSQIINKENRRPKKQESVVNLLKKQAQKYDKALIVLQAHFNSYKEHSEKQMKSLNQEISSLKKEAERHQGFKEKVVQAFKSQLTSLKEQMEEQHRKQVELLNLKLNQQQRQMEDFNQDRLKTIRRNYEKELSEQSQYIMSLKKPQGYNDLIRENQKLRDELTSLWKDYGRNRLRMEL